MVWYRRYLALGCCLALSACATSSIEKQGPAYRIAMPAGKWVLEFPDEGFKINTADTSRPYYFLSSPELNVSFSFDRATRCASSEACRDYHAGRLKAAYPHPRKQAWRMSQVGEVFVSENTDGPVEGFNLKQRHWNAHYVLDGIWVDVHLSKTDYRESDRELFARFIRSLKLKPKT